MKKWISLLAVAMLFIFSLPVQAGLIEYVKKEDKSYKWELKKTQDMTGGKVHHIFLTSQVWQGITWTHDLLIFVPEKVKDSSTVMILNTGGKPNTRHYMFGLMMAEKIEIPLAVIFQIPNQPLFGKKKEDALIAETFVRYLKTKDESWPLLFPMAKSVVRAMDTIQTFSEKNWKQKTEHFIITGSSKRGWTTWLTGASDPRVKGIAPMVIDTLNMAKQMEHQKKCYNVVSSKLDDYKNRGLLDILNDPSAKRLMELVDPYSYRQNLKMPKFILIGTNDPYWVVDSLNLYWDDLEGEKHVLYVPNAGHSLMEQTAPGIGNLNRAMNGLAAFARHVASNKAMPKLSWKFEDRGEGIYLQTKTDTLPRAVRIWTAESPVRDFRKAQWKNFSLSGKIDSLGEEVPLPVSGYKAFYMEMDFKIDKIVYQVSTQIYVVQAPTVAASASAKGEKHKEN